MPHQGKGQTVEASHAKEQTVEESHAKGKAVDRSGGKGKTADGIGGKGKTVEASGSKMTVEARTSDTSLLNPDFDQGSDSSVIMVRPLRRLRNLNLQQEEEAEPIENGQDNLAECENEQDNLADYENGHSNLPEHGNDETLQSPPDVDGLLARLPSQHPRTPINIIC
ncbi:hypothetical protein GUJ93_ZPchr0009g1835 [Zizania palustris]|uniref:Uncharacterized protein n=1 Tax=Zizania palustris TaxID=103762 RepID=A0A8J5VKU8_ZIZPA|nr:hypothetical protein GUJ93_ZPchr0009g1835 [Zizania palustris]